MKYTNCIQNMDRDTGVRCVSQYRMIVPVYVLTESMQMEKHEAFARECAAFQAYAYLVSHRLWIDLKDAHLVPSMEHSVNQLQELYQKGYTEQPVYEYKALDHDQWQCSCLCSGINVYGTVAGKTKAKKQAAYMVLVRLMEAAGLCEEEWEQIMWQTMNHSDKLK